ncbi:MAG TPA: hypothetical protein VFP49_00710 [Nitrososphaeraceae archaeon]|jgi:NMD protein affecting ribosome stability and mRNA decay|nr:hypothetical protein [Nitrososphaeraceae archaeon]
MSSMVFCAKCGKTEKQQNQFTNKDGNTICKDCWLADSNNNKDN